MGNNPAVLGSSAPLLKVLSIFADQDSSILSLFTYLKCIPELYRNDHITIDLGYEAC